MYHLSCTDSAGDRSSLQLHVAVRDRASRSAAAVRCGALIPLFLHSEAARPGRLPHHALKARAPAKPLGDRSPGQEVPVGELRSTRHKHKAGTTSAPSYRHGCTRGRRLPEQSESDRRDRNESSCRVGVHMMSADSR